MTKGSGEARSPTLQFCSRLWRNHSLTIVLTIIGTALNLAAFQLEPGKWFDLLQSHGAGTLTVALLNALSGPFREKNKPDE